MALGQVEYGSTSSFAAKNGARKQRIMLGLCVASMLLAIAALTTNQEQGGAMTLEEKMQALKTGTQVAESATPIVAAAQPKDATHALAESSPAASAATHEAAVAPKVAETATVAAPKAEKPEVKEAVAAAPAKTQQQAAAKPEEPTKAAASPKVEEAAKPAALPHEQVAKAVEKPAEISKPASVAHAVSAEAAKQKQLALAHLARVSKHAAVHDHMLASNSTSDDSASDSESTAAGEDGLNSPLGNLEPTGIMSVFFNEKIMLTALGVIAGLLVLICCFARNADCALS